MTAQWSTSDRLRDRATPSDHDTDQFEFRRIRIELDRQGSSIIAGKKVAVLVEDHPLHKDLAAKLAGNDFSGGRRLRRSGCVERVVVHDARLDHRIAEGAEDVLDAGALERARYVE